MLALEDDPMSKLCSEDQLQLLNAVDKLRAQGISNYVSLPQIIVVGDQSSGKSSVLEAISGVSFPIKSNLCTRFPTELILRRTPLRSARVSIVPHEERSESEQKALRGFTQELLDLDDLPELIEDAKGAMGISPHGKAFAKDILRVEVTGPDRPHLTMVDLPGLIHSETKNQSASDVQLIQDVVQGYMKQSRCIILAVISAKNDFANQIVLKLARTADPTGNRTLGVITKPDTLTTGSASESLYLALARNQEVEFRLGWHVVKNMDSEKGAWTHGERDAEEDKFFSQGIWSELPPSSLGVGTFRGRLSKVLLGQIIAELPGLLNEIDKKFSSCQKQLTSLGDPRANSFDQRHYLFQLAESFQALVKSSVSGNYIDKFFKPAKTPIGYEQRIRAVVQNLNEDFASGLSTLGHRWKVSDALSALPLSTVDVGNCPLGKVTKVRREDFISYVEYLQKRTRGRELPGTFNPMLVADLFLEQSGNWEAIARAHVDTVWKAVNRFLELVIAHIADESTAVAMHREVVKPAMKQVLKDMRNKTTELLLPHQNAHPITYNDTFLEVLEKVRVKRREKEFSDIVKDFFAINSTQNLTSSARWTLAQGGYDLGKLVKDLANAEGMGMKRLAATDAMDCLDAYYKVALRRFIDDISVQVIEEKLVNVLDNILSPVSVYHMTPNLAARIAGEPEDSRMERAQLTKQLEVLAAGLETCKRFVGLKLTGG
ncbi:interferon-induced GTP-binding protein Mx [Cercophora samala]|uniref:Interferon-induced GTP-binding protein Mx n=1 Tax=Cercophora samala TaxID=330535 RepID=A0AA40D843_9PEZI|nr:interferon-induced GTP-binding protein Mx [Cercophora samala]